MEKGDSKETGGTGSGSERLDEAVGGWDGGIGDEENERVRWEGTEEGGIGEEEDEVESLEEER